MPGTGTTARNDLFHPPLTTDRLRLRRPAIADARAIAALANDRRIAENTRRVPFPYRLRDAEEFLVAAAEGRAGTVLAIERRDGELIGLCGLDWTGRNGPELGYWLGAPHWGYGYASEAVRAVTGHVFETTRIDRIVSGARVTNAASRRVLEKCGFEWTGVELHRFAALRSSAPVDRLVLTRKAWSRLDPPRPVRRVA